MRLHILYRTTGSENRKRRPAFYSKRLALDSFLAALRCAPDVGDLVFIVDGPMPDDELTRLRAEGEVIPLEGIGNSASYRRALGLLDERPRWHDDDVVYFAEDDYLYRPMAFRALMQAARSLDRASFFTLYDHPDYYEHPAQLRFARMHRSESWSVGDTSWRSVRATTMTFAARLAAMRRVSYLHVLGTRGGYPRDYDIWSASQTYLPQYLMSRAFLSSASASPRPALRTTARSALGSFMGRPPRNLLVAPRAPLATHLEDGLLAPGVDWSAVASGEAGTDDVGGSPVSCRTAVAAWSAARVAR